MEAERKLVKGVREGDSTRIEALPGRDLPTESTESMIKSTALLVANLTGIDVQGARVAEVDSAAIPTATGVTDITTVQLMLPTVRPEVDARHELLYWVWKPLAEFAGEEGAEPDEHLRHIRRRMSPPNSCEPEQTPEVDAMAQAISDTISLSTDEVLEGVIGHVGKARGILAVDN